MPQPDETQPLGAGDATVSLPSPGAGPEAAAATFGAGEIVAGRFRILRLLGRGGMGEVFEAEDLELREHVALKTVRPEIAADPQAVARFRQETQLSRKVTHPNVCRIFDLFRHGEITFLTMELLPGDTLAQRLKRRGRMHSAEALPFVRQMAGALAAAHAAGVIHRDFKTSNVILARGPSGASGLHPARLPDRGVLRQPLLETHGHPG